MKGDQEVYREGAAAGEMPDFLKLSSVFSPRFLDLY